MNNNIKAVIFDMDGVIADTQTIHNETNAEILQSYGIPLSSKDMSKFAGIPNKKTFADLFKKYNVNADVDKAVSEKWDLIKEKTKVIKAIPGVLDFIQKLYSNKFKMAIASSSPADFIDHVLLSLKIKDFFTIIINGDEVKKGKPSPDIFLKAAKKLKVKPLDCLVFEDAPAGIQAAKNAGMKCIAITTAHKKEDLSRADKIIDSFSELTIENLNNL